MRENIVFLALMAMMLMSRCYGEVISGSVQAGSLEYGKSYIYPLSFTNPENYTESVVLGLTPRSQYLGTFVILIPNSFDLGPQETKVINVTINTLESLPPGEHIVTILPEESKAGKEGILTMASRIAEVGFSLPGSIVRSAQLENVEAINDSGFLRFDLTVKNTGTVRIGAFANADISRMYGSMEAHIETLKGNTQYLINPGEEKILSVRYDGSPLDGGDYKATANISYDGGYSNTIYKAFTWGRGTPASGGSQNTGGGANTKPTPPSGGAGSGLEALPGSDYPFINIGGPAPESAGQGTGQEENAAENPSIPVELRINLLETRNMSGGSVLILLGIENIYEGKTSYKARVKIFEENETLLEELEKDGEIDGKKAVVLEILPDKIRESGNYLIEASIEYENRTDKKLMPARITLREDSAGGSWEDGLSGLSGLTGNLIQAAEGKSMTLALVIIAAILGIVYLRGRRNGGGFAGSI